MPDFYQTLPRHVKSDRLLGVTEDVDRHARVQVSYCDLNGTERIEEADGLLAVCHQHEIDQLDGIFWTQRLSRLRRERVIKRYEKLLRTP